MTTLYKITDKDGSPVHGGKGKWSLPSRGKPGAWREVEGALIPCKNGLHLLETTDIASWLKWPAVLWVAEHEGEMVRDTDKSVAGKARLVRKVPGYSEKSLRLFAVECAERVLPIFERQYPDDDRVRACIKATRRYLQKKATKKQLDEARAAAVATALAAHAAAVAAAVAAVAADAAAVAADDAAADHARKAEHDWQAKRFAEIIGL